MTKKILLIDTNNYIEPLEGGFKSIQIELEDLKALKKLLDDNDDLTLILPETTKLECERLYLEKNKELDKKFRELQKNLNLDSIRVRKKIEKELEKIAKNERQRQSKIKKLIEQIFNHKNAEFLELNDEIYIRSYKRVLLGQKPFNKKKHQVTEKQVVHSVHPDVLFIEAAKHYLSSKGVKKYKLIICSRDPDFSETDGNELDPQIKSEFLEAKLYKTLRECLRTEFAVSLPPLPLPEQEEIEEKQLGKKIPPVPMETLIDELEKSGSFDEARKNMKNILFYKTYLDSDHLKKILKAMFSNPYDFTINQVVAVDIEQDFSKKLFMKFKDEEKTWKDFADDLELFYEDKLKNLKNYNWLFRRLGMGKFIDADDIPF